MIIEESNTKKLNAEKLKTDIINIEKLNNEIKQYIGFFIENKINLIDYAQKNSITILTRKNTIDKGWKGNTIEHILNIKKNNSCMPDLSWAEVKTVPVTNKKNLQMAKETICLSVINTKELITKTFEESSFFKKIKSLILININVENQNHPYISKITFFDLEKNKEIYEQIKKDYETLANHILDNIENNFNDNQNFSAKFGEIIQPRPKTGKKGNYTWAFYLKKPLLNKIINDQPDLSLTNQKKK